MIKVNKVNLKVTEHTKELGNSRLDFKMSGPNINYIVANTIRRTIFSDIPVYAFNEFKFEKNTSVFHNNYLKLRLRHMPVWGIENTVEYIDYNIKSNKNELEDIPEETAEETETPVASATEEDEDETSDLPWEKETSSPYKVEAPAKTSNADKFDSLFNEN